MKVSEQKNLSFTADQFSGVEGCLYTMSFILEVFRYSTRKKFKAPFYALTFSTKNNRVIEWIDQEGYEEATQKIMEFVKEDGFSYFADIQDKIQKSSLEFLEYSQKLKDDFSKFNNDELVESYNLFCDKYAESYALGVVTFLYESIVSEKLISSLSQRVDNPTDIVSSLLHTGYKSFMIENDELLFKIKQSSGKVQEEFVNEYLSNFFYMGTNYADLHEFTEEKVLERAEDAHFSSPQRPDIKIEEIELNSEEENIVKLLRYTESIRDNRKKINLIGNFMMFRFLKEASLRTKTDFQILKRLFWFELPELFKDTENVISKLKSREKASAVFVDGEYYYLEYDALVPKEENLKDKMCKGTPACSGKVEGKASIILGSKEFSRFKEGEILITEMTRPDFLPIMRKAKAIITDEGGLTCHAAIVSRELGIPCIVGTRNATRVFQNGDLVEVDADKGIVKILEKNHGEQ